MKSKVCRLAQRLRKTEGLTLSKAMKKAWAIVKSGMNTNTNTNTNTPKKQVKPANKNNSWFNRFFEEKGIAQDLTFEVKGASGVNIMTYRVVIDMIKIAPDHEKIAIRNALSRIDFQNGDVCGYLRHLAQALAK